MISGSDILYLQINKKVIVLNHQCKTENGIESDEDFTVSKIIGNYEQLEIVNQYNQKYIINPNQIINNIYGK